MNQLLKLFLMAFLVLQLSLLSQAQDEALALELDTPYLFEKASASDVFDFTYTGTEGEVVIITIMPINDGAISGDVEIADSAGTKLLDSFLALQLRLYLPAADVYTIHLVPQNNDNYEITISHPRELFIGDSYEGTMSSPLSQFFILRNITRFNIDFNYTQSENGPTFDALVLGSLSNSMSGGYLFPQFVVVEIPEISMTIPDLEQDYYMIELRARPFQNIYREYDENTYRLSITAPETP